jgi:hypothetical protein
MSPRERLMHPSHACPTNVKPHGPDKRPMDTLVVVVLSAAGVAVYLTAAWLSTESRAVLVLAICAVIASIVLVLAAGLIGLCGLAENRSELFDQRCEGSVPYIPLYTIPLVLAVPFLRRFASGALLLVMGGLLVAAAIVIPLRLLSV